MPRPLIILTVIACAATCGCVRHTVPMHPGPQTVPETDSFQNVWQASLWALNKYYFTVDHQDRRTGTITTQPLTGKHVFEFWRKDAVTWDDTYENTVQTIYRMATVTIKPTTPGGKTFKAEVKVIVGRSNKSQVRINTLSDAYNLSFTSPLSESRQYQKRDKRAVDDAVAKAIKTGQPITPAYPPWLTLLGRDELLQRDILFAIEEAATKRSYMGGIVAH